MRWLSILPMLALLAQPLPAQAARELVFMSGNELLQLCTSVDVAQRQRCGGYVRGAFDMNAEWLMDAKQRNCIDDALVASQAIDATVKWLQEHIAERSHAAPDAILGAIEETWPCPKK
jgi:hypothetical protein